MYIQGDTIGVLAASNGQITLDFTQGTDGQVDNGVVAMDGGTINFITDIGVTKADFLATDGGTITISTPQGLFEGSTENYSLNVERDKSLIKVNQDLALGSHFNTQGHITVELGGFDMESHKKFLA